MSEDKLQAAVSLSRDNAAKEAGYENYDEAFGILSSNLNGIVNRSYELFAAQCVKDERERIKKALPIILEKMAMGGTVPFETERANAYIFGAENFKDRLSQLIERGEG